MTISHKASVIIGAALTGFMGITSTAFALTVYYQPTPYPNVNQSGTHVWDGWLGNVYNTNFQWNNYLQVGGWGDQYRSYIKFDTTGLPSNVSQAVIWLYPYSTTNPTAIGFNTITSAWTTDMSWATQPNASLIGWRAAPVAGQWWGTILTSQYNAWLSSPSTNYGWRLDPLANNNNFTYFYSSRSTSDAYRPLLQLDFTPPVSVPDFLMPLPGSHRWLVTTDAGGYDCKGSQQDTRHADETNNYFSIDFTYDSSVYNSNSDIPVIAAASGVVAAVVNNDPYNGNYVVINHNGVANVTNGFTTRYLHLKSLSSLQRGQTVSQGDLLGYMGNTGQSSGVHLHFGTRYNDSGMSNSMAQYVVNNGWLLKGFQSECSGGTWNRYYTSSNRVY